jgi:ubiquitin carboxyl-terminal hydrolase 10
LFFIVVQLDSIRSVNDALEHFVKKEELFGFTDQETKKEIEAFRRISFEDLPPVLILYLKCFVYDKNGGIQKILKRLDFLIDLEINKGKLTYYFFFEFQLKI